MKTEFNEIEVNDYINNLSPAEKGAISMTMIMAIECVVEMHFQEHDTISLIELVAFISSEYAESKVEQHIEFGK